MGLFSTDKPGVESVLKKYFSFRNESKSLEVLTEVLNSITRTPFSEVLQFLRENPDITANFAYFIHHIFSGKSFNLSLTEANILSENAFLPEFRKRILNKVLPPVADENTVWHLIDFVSVQTRKDLQYFRNAYEEDLDEFFRVLHISEIIINTAVKNELFFAMNILAWRVIGNAMDVEVVNMAPQYKNFDNPFLALQDEMDVLTKEFRDRPDFTLHSKDQHYKQIKIYITQCLDYVDLAFKNSSKFGISGKINQSLLKIRQQLNRMQDILNLLVLDDEKDVLIKSKQLFFNILEYKSHKNNLRELVDDSTRLMSHLITNHTAETGAHYITSTRKDYLKMLWKASAGGIIIGACSILKILYSELPASEFGHAVLYALNYALCFVVIYLMGYTVATKQPAMTAATMAKVLSDGQNNNENYREFARFFSRLFRSQFIAFVGNVLLTFPSALAVIYGLDVLFHENFGTAKADKLFKDINLFESKALFHASIAGVFLFFSGIISGNVGNRSVFFQIPKRIDKNPFLNYFFGEKTASRISRYYARNWAGIVSNFWFGVFLGVTGTIGMFLGLDLDIRHITFSTGNFAAALYGKGFDVGFSTIFISSLTVCLIGFFNFAVSFGLSMMLAFRSRQVNLADVGGISKEIFKYFKEKPLHFFLPMKSPAEVTPSVEKEKTNG